MAALRSHYNVAVTILSMLIAVAVVCVGLFIVGDLSKAGCGHASDSRAADRRA